LCQTRNHFFSFLTDLHNHIGFKLARAAYTAAL
jgi:hypothetical protein